MHPDLIIPAVVLALALGWGARGREKVHREHRVPGNNGPWQKPVAPPKQLPPPGLPPRASADSGRSATPGWTMPPFGVVHTKTVVGSWQIRSEDGALITEGDVYAWSLDAGLMGDYELRPLPPLIVQGWTITVEIGPT